MSQTREFGRARLPGEQVSTPTTSTTTEKFWCPVCNEEMVSVGQLNQHLDDVHGEEDGGAVVSWLKRTQKKMAASTNPLAKELTKIVQKSPSIPLLDKRKSSITPNTTLERPSSPSTPIIPSTPVKTTVYVTKTHWQKETDQDYCCLKGCGRPLGVRFGKFNCRKCGKLFCDDHTNVFMRLAPDASHDPETGGFCRVCLDCFRSQPGYNDSWGLSRRKTNVFQSLRKKTVHRGALEGTKLEKRYEKLARLYADEQELGSAIDIFKSAFLNRRSLATAEQGVVAWQVDASVMRCPLCEEVFGLTLRRHHCRLCGRVVCGKSSCSDVVPLLLDLLNDDFSQAVGETRACRECRDIVFSKRDEAQYAKYSPIIVGHHEHLMKLRTQVEALLPSYNNLLFSLRKKSHISVKDVDFQEASRLRKQLVELLAEYDQITRQIRALPAPSAGFVKLHQNIAAASAAYVQDHMFTLKLLPDPTKQVQVQELESNLVRMHELQRDLETFKEQRSMLHGYQMDAQRFRKFEDVASLQVAMDEIDAEIERVTKELEILKT